MRLLGTSTLGYPERRNFVDLPYTDVYFKKVQSLSKVPAVLSEKLLGRHSQYYWNQFRDFDFNGVELLHFFNGLSFGSKPWITTFETCLPRWGGKNTVNGINLLAGDSCKKIIALSDNAKFIQREFLYTSYPERLTEIEDKLMVLKPAQEIYENIAYKGQIENDKIRFAFVGADFFRKGGKEVLRAFDELNILYQDFWHLTIISSLNYGDYATNSTIEDYNHALALIEKHNRNITHLNYLPNKEVIKVLQNSHVGLLPSHADTFGYSVLESQGCGCPVISTDIRALPEINNGALGFEITVPKDGLNEALYSTARDRKLLSTTITDGLLDHITGILENPRLLVEKHENVSTIHQGSLKRNARILEDLYMDILR